MSTSKSRKQLRLARKLHCCNSAKLRYSREQLLDSFSGLPAPFFACDAAPVLAPDAPAPPLFAGGLPFTHALGRKVNSRRSKKPKKSLATRTAESTGSIGSFGSGGREDYLRGLVTPEAAGQAAASPPNRLVRGGRPEEAVKYTRSFLEKQLAAGNPFAEVMLMHCVADASDLLSPAPASQPFEKVWTYKDPGGRVRGPFSSIEMFNWMAAGYFSSALELAHSSTTCFAPLYMYVLHVKSSLVQPS